MNDFSMDFGKSMNFLEDFIKKYSKKYQKLLLQIQLIGETPNALVFQLYSVKNSHLVIKVPKRIENLREAPKVKHEGIKIPKAHKDLRKEFKRLVGINDLILETHISKILS